MADSVRLQEESELGASSTTATAVVPASYASELNFEEIVREARESRASVNKIIREHIILQMLKREHVLNCSQDSAQRCSDEIKAYVLAHGKQLGMSQSTIEAIMRFKLDKKTLQASLTSLAGRGLLWLQVRPMSSISTCPNVPKNLRLAIARDVDPHGPTVQAYLLSLQEPRALRTMMSISKLPTLEANIEVQRSEGAQKIDDEIRGAVKQYELERSLMKRSQYRFTMAHRTPMDDNDHWFYIVQRLEARPRDICRIMDLHEWLVAQLPNAVDNKSVFPMYTFRPTFLFSHISLELILRMGGGISRHQGLRHFVRFGYDGKYPDSTEDEAMDDVERFPSSSREEMEARLAMPIHKLPAGVSQRFIERSSRTRVYFQRLLHELCLLRVLRPVAEIANIGDMPAPLDAQDASIMPDHPRIMAFAYQLIGVGRLVSRETVVNLADQPRFHGDQTFALLEPEGIAAFWEATMRLHTASKTLLPQSHLFHGIDRRMCWRRVLALTVRQSNVLLQYTNEETLMTPLGNAEMLETAAMAAQVPVSLARKFYKNIQITYDMRATKRDNQRKAYMKSMIERARAKAAEAEERRARGEMPEPAPKRVRLKHRRQPWTRAESCMVAMAFAVLINHARMHGHPFRVVAVSDLFLTYSASRNPNERVRKHWARIRQNPEMCALADALTILWRYVLDDALAEDALEDPPSLEDVDLKKAVYYFRDLLRTTSVESLIDRYAGQIAADEPAGWEDLLMGRHKMAPMDTGDVPVPAPVPVPEKQRSKDVALRYALASGALSRGQYQNVNTRLPATMKGCDDRYTVLTLTPDSRLRGLSRPAALLVLQEDLYYVNMTARNRQNNTYTTMLTAHMGASNMGDAARPVATDLKLPGEPESMVVAPAAEQLQGTDTMAPFWPIARTVDADALASGLQRLMLGDAEKVDGQMDVDAPAGTIAGDSEATEDAVSSARPVTSTPLGSQSSSAEQYAEVAAMQAMLVNLTLTPETQYNVTVGHDLLKAKGDASSEALESLTRHSSVVLLHSMESAVGLKDSNNSRSAADGPAGPVTAASTVVVHETQGTTRVATKEAPDNADVDAEIEMGLAAEGIEMEKQKASGSAVRQVPGRGMAISDKFLGAIAPTLPSNMFENDLTDAVSEGSLVDYHMQPSELVQLCDDVARCRLWLRPVYSKKLTNRRDNHYLTEAIRGAQAAGIMFFRPKVHYYRSAADAEPMDRWVDLEHSSRERGLRIVALSEESLEIASRLLCGCADLMGALGCSAYELCQLFERIDQSAFGGIRGDLLEELSEFMCAEPRVSALLRLLAADLVPGVPVCVRGQLVAVGSGDVRYVSRRVFDLHWSVRTKSAKQVYGDVQYLPVFGQSLSGRVLTQYTGQMMLSVLGWVFNNPGISLASLMRRYYSPMIPRFEVARYLGVLVDLGVLQGNWVEENRSTEYFLGERYYESAKQVEEQEEEQEEGPTHSTRSTRKGRLTRRRPDASANAQSSTTDDVPEESRSLRRRTPRKNKSSAERLAVLQKLMSALRQGTFDSESENSEASTGASDDDKDDDKGDDDGDDGDYGNGDKAVHEEGDLGEQGLKKKEKKLVLRFKKAKLQKDTRQGDAELQVEDVDWAEFDEQTILEILARREAMMKERQAVVTTTAGLKKSSLAPPPLQLEKHREAEKMDVVEQEPSHVWMGDDMEEGEVEGVAENEHTVLSGLFDEDLEDLSREDNMETVEQEEPSAALHLPPRAHTLSAQEDSQYPPPSAAQQYQQPPLSLPRHLRPHPALIRSGLADSAQASGPKDMRLVLQYELQREETLLKDLRAEIMDKLFKLQAEEKLLRMIVREDIDIGDEDDDMDGGSAAVADGVSGFGTFVEQPELLPHERLQKDLEHHVQGQSGMDAFDMLGGHDAAGMDEESDGDDSSLSGMSSSSSSSSEDEVQDEEMARGALSRIVDQYLPRTGTNNGAFPDND
ncbi:hypothetical protein GGI07_004471 [Coemansia sp. Benny D115]|nr:hypothetical protein GGI07_004471 [Coemansia sp. Benny D115]